MNEDKIRQRAKECIANLIVELAGCLDAEGWAYPAGQIDFLLGTCIEPAVEMLKQLRAQSQELSAFGEAPEDVPLPDLHEPV